MTETKLRATAAWIGRWAPVIKIGTRKMPLAMPSKPPTGLAKPDITISPNVASAVTLARPALRPPQREPHSAPRLLR